MQYTTPDNLPIAEPGDTVGPLEERFADLARAVQDALNRRVGALDTPNTGWLKCRFFDSFDGEAYAWQLGPFVFMHGTVHRKDNSQFPNGYTDVGYLPEGIVNAFYFRSPGTMYNGRSANVIFTNGTIKIGVEGGMSADVVYFDGIVFAGQR